MSIQRKAAVIAACVAAATGSSLAAAADFEYEVSALLGQSDNITRVSANEQDETIAGLGLKFSLYQDSSRIKADVVGDIAYNDYLDDTYDSEVLGNLAANATFALIPEHLNWAVSDHFGQTLVDPFTAPTPDNREDLNYFTTGPDVFFSFGSRTRLQLGARYGDTSYEEQPFDSSMVMGQIGLTRELSSASSLGFVASQQQVEYDDATLNGDFDQSEAFLRYSMEGARTTIEADAGYTVLDRDAVSDDEDGVLFRLQFSRKVGAHSVLKLTGGHEFASSGSAFANDQAGSDIGVETSPVRQTIQPFTNEYATFDWTITGRRTEIAFETGWSDHSYQDGPDLNQTMITFGASARRDITAAMSLSLDYDLSKSDFDVEGDYDDQLIGLSLDWQVSRFLSLSLQAEHYDRNSDLGNGDYTENRFWLSLGYGRGAPRSRMGAYAPGAE